MEIGSIKCVNNLVADLTPVTNDVQRNTLKFHQDGVTHVLTISAAEGFILDTFTRNASQQKYFPKYVIASSGAHLYNNSRQDSKAAVHFSPDALPNMSGIAFRPLDDVGAAKAKPANPAQAAAQARCKAADPGRKPDADPENEGFARDQWYTVCDAFFALIETLELNGVAFGLGDIAAGYHAMLGRTASAGAVGGHYAGGNARVDGIGRVQGVKYDPGTKHFVYVGAPMSVP